MRPAPLYRQDCRHRQVRRHHWEEILSETDSHVQRAPTPRRAQRLHEVCLVEGSPLLRRAEPKDFESSRSQTHRLLAQNGRQ